MIDTQKETLVFFSVAFDNAAFPSHQPENEQKLKLAFILFYYSFLFFPSFFHVFWLGWGEHVPTLAKKKIKILLHLGQKDSDCWTFGHKQTERVIASPGTSDKPSARVLHAS